jgi:hypothetical protein
MVLMRVSIVDCAVAAGYCFPDNCTLTSYHLANRLSNILNDDLIRDIYRVPMYFTNITATRPYLSPYTLMVRESDLVTRAIWPSILYSKFVWEVLQAGCPG